jgi:hypothetical protein
MVNSSISCGLRTVPEMSCIDVSNITECFPNRLFVFTVA